MNQVSVEKGYRNLKVYQEAHKLVVAVYEITKNFPKVELFGLVSQMRRAAASVVANILEGHARTSKKEFRQFVSMANGSLVELEYYLELSLALDYFTQNQFDNLDKQRHSVGSLLGGLRRYLRDA